MDGRAAGTESASGKSGQLLGAAVLVACALLFLLAILSLLMGDVVSAIFVFLLVALIYSQLSLYNKIEEVQKSLREIERRLESQTEKNDSKLESTA